jgi:antitoxin FitA
MAQLLVRNLDDEVKAKLQRRARQHGRSTEAEARAILREAVEGGTEPGRGLGSQIAARFAGLGMPDIEEQRGHPARPAEFDD